LISKESLLIIENLRNDKKKFDLLRGTTTQGNTQINNEIEDETEGGDEDNYDEESLSLVSQFASDSKVDTNFVKDDLSVFSRASSTLISLGAKNDKNLARTREALDNGADNDNQGHMILTVCYGRDTEIIGTIKVNHHTNYPQAKELIKPLVSEYLAGLGKLSLAETLISHFQILDPKGLPIKGPEESVRTIWAEASIADHKVIVRPANWIDLPNREIKKSGLESSGRGVTEFVAFEYDNDAFGLEAGGIDDMSVMSHDDQEDEGLDGFNSSVSASSYLSQGNYFDKVDSAKKEKVKWI
jgi:hypothetical protein